MTFTNCSQIRELVEVLTNLSGNESIIDTTFKTFQNKSLEANLQKTSSFWTSKVHGGSTLFLAAKQSGPKGTSGFTSTQRGAPYALRKHRGDLQFTDHPKKERGLDPGRAATLEHQILWGLYRLPIEISPKRIVR